MGRKFIIKLREGDKMEEEKKAKDDLAIPPLLDRKQQRLRAEAEGKEQEKDAGTPAPAETPEVFVSLTKYVEEHNTIVQEIKSLAPGLSVRERSSFKNEDEAKKAVARVRSSLKAVKDGQAAEARRDKGLPAGDEAPSQEEVMAPKTATKKASAKKKAPAKKKAAPRRASAGGVTDETKITLKFKENPGREGTKTHKVFAKMKTGMTFAQLVKVGAGVGWTRANARTFLVTHAARGSISYR